MQTSEKDIEQLNSFLRGELSAVETYEQCIGKLSEDPMAQAELRQLQSSHRRRVDVLSSKVRELGGEPAESSGVWGGFAKLVEAGAKAFGKNAAIAALEEGEDHGRNDYRRDLDELSIECRSFVQSQILPEQQRTHDVMSALKKRFKS